MCFSVLQGMLKFRDSTEGLYIRTTTVEVLLELPHATLHIPERDIRVDSSMNRVLRIISVTNNKQAWY